MVGPDARTSNTGSGEITPDSPVSSLCIRSKVAFRWCDAFSDMNVVLCTGGDFGCFANLIGWHVRRTGRQDVGVDDVSLETAKHLSHKHLGTA